MEAQQDFRDLPALSNWKQSIRNECHERTCWFATSSITVPPVHADMNWSAPSPGDLRVSVLTRGLQFGRMPLG